jgi:hypothetical protein
MANERQQQAKRNAQMEADLKRRSMQRQGLPQNRSAQSLQSTLKKALPQNMLPGNVGSINRVIWPFWFTFTAPELVPNSSSSGFTTISQEAAFVWMSYTKAVFKKTAGPVYTAIDPEDETAAGGTDGLKFSIRDAQSSRVFHNNPIELDLVGHPDYPSVLPTPIMFLPSSTVEMNYVNESASDTYVPFITMFGYRIRIEDAQNILSLVQG